MRKKNNHDGMNFCIHWIRLRDCPSRAEMTLDSVLPGTAQLVMGPEPPPTTWLDSLEARPFHCCSNVPNEMTLDVLVLECTVKGAPLTIYKVTL